MWTWMWLWTPEWNECIQWSVSMILKMKRKLLKLLYCIQQINSLSSNTFFPFSIYGGHMIWFWNNSCWKKAFHNKRGVSKYNKTKGHADVCMEVDKRKQKCWKKVGKEKNDFIYVRISLQRAIIEFCEIKSIEKVK